MSERIMSRPLSRDADAEWDRIFGKRDRPEYNPPPVEPSAIKVEPRRSASKMVTVPRQT